MWVSMTDQMNRKLRRAHHTDAASDGGRLSDYLRGGRRDVVPPAGRHIAHADNDGLPALLQFQHFAVDGV